MEEETVGFRFHPTGYELVNHYLKRKLQKIDDVRCPIPEINIYDYNPQELRAVYKERSCMRSNSRDSFFFCPLSKLNPEATRFKRQAKGGYWKGTGEKKVIEDEKGKTIGTRRILTFHSGKQGHAQKTDWAMHEYHLNADAADCTISDPMAIAICHIKKKARGKGSSKKKLSRMADSPSYETNSSSPEEIKSPGENIQVQGILMHQPSEPMKSSLSVGVISPEQVQMVDQSADSTHGSSQEHGSAYKFTPCELSNANLQSNLEFLGLQDSSPTFSFNWQLSMENSSLWIEPSTFGRSGCSTGEACHNEGIPAPDDSCEDGIRLSVMDFGRDYDMAQEEIWDVLSTQSGLLA